MTLRNTDDLKEWKYCPVCSYPLSEASLIVKGSDVTSFEVGCKNGHEFILSHDHRRREVMLRAWGQNASNRPPEAPKIDTGLDAWGLCVVCGRLPDERGRCPVHG